MNARILHRRFRRRRIYSRKPSTNIYSYGSWRCCPIDPQGGRGGLHRKAVLRNQ